MNNRVVKAALLASVAAACGYAGAATLGVATGAKALDGDAKISLEGAKVTPVTVKVGVSIQTSVSHFAGDEWQLTIDKGTWASAGASSLSLTCGTSDPITLDQIPTYSSDKKSLTFTVGSTSGTTTGVNCVFSSLGVHGPDLTAGAVKVSFAARRAGNATFDRDQTAAAVKVFSVDSQLGAITVLSVFNGVVDYQGSAGKGFATDDSVLDGATDVAGDEDSLVLAIARGSDAANTAYSLAGNVSLTFVLKAESGKTFSFLDANGDGTCAPSEWATSTANGDVGPEASTITINSTCTELTFVNASQTIPGQAADGSTYTVALGSKFTSPSVGTAGPTITPMDFTATSTAALSKGSVAIGTSATALDAGAWTSNGSTVNIPYMPVNTVAASRIAPVVYITNRSLVSGPATATMRNESGVECQVSLGTIQAQRTTNVSNLINDAVKTCYNTSSAAEAAGHRLSITITASLPSADTEVYSAFTVGGTSRVSVVNSSNGK
jgi:hypothetical protein